MNAYTAEELSPEQVSVLDWRFECLRQAGVDYEQANLLALSQADLHEMLRTLARGCPPGLLAGIYG